ncbi:MAG TPA: GAF domain-containing protein [Nocardioidaceae bacterium]|nr:GAF domain-containing protein [Nocardioidaceae bacterium]
MRRLEPTPETLEAIKELNRLGSNDVAVALLRLCREVVQVVPEAVGLSLGMVAGELTFTAIATDHRISGLDSMQYLGGGPCVEAAETGERREQRDDALDEARWADFARAGAAIGVAATLSLPIVFGGRVTATVNLYAATADAFDGRHEELARRCGAWAPGAVSNADLTFSSREAAAATPARLRDTNAIEVAVGLLMDAYKISDEAAAARLRDAAERAGITEGQAARVIIRAILPS